MARLLKLPDALDSATLAAWLVAEGAPVRAGQPLARLDLEGASHVVPSDRDGVLLRTLLRDGLRVGSGAPLAILGERGEDIGYDPRAVRCVRVMLLRRCDECGNDYPVNGLVDRVACTRCGDDQRLPPSFWRDFPAEHVEKAKTPRHGSGGSRLAPDPATIQCVGIPPLCRKCPSLLPWVDLSSAWQAAQASGGASSVACRGCGEGYLARFPPPWAASVFPGLLFLLGETARMGAPAAGKPVVFKCPSCLASLPLDAAAKRVTTCRFCDDDVYLPDDLWLHLNPSTRRARWWMLFQGA